MATEYASRFIKSIVDAVPGLIEQGVIAGLRANEDIDTAANWLGGGYKGGGIDGEHSQELVYFKDPSGKMSLVGSRNYALESGEKPLQNFAEIEFKDGRIQGYKTGKPGDLPHKVSPNIPAEVLGSIYSATGGIYLGKRGYSDQYKKIDPTRTRVMLADISLKYYEDKVMKQGKSLGNNFFTVEIPVSRGPFGILRPGNYDTGLSLKMGEVGIFFDALGPAFKAARKALEGAGLGEAAENTIYEMQLGLSADLAETGGGLALAWYPFATAGHLAKRFILDGWNFEEMRIDAASRKARRN